MVCIRISDPRNGDQSGYSSVRLMHHDPDRSWITDPDPDPPKGTQPYNLVILTFRTEVKCRYSDNTFGSIAAGKILCLL